MRYVPCPFVPMAACGLAISQHREAASGEVVGARGLYRIKNEASLQARQGPARRQQSDEDGNHCYGKGAQRRTLPIENRLANELQKGDQGVDLQKPAQMLLRS